MKFFNSTFLCVVYTVCRKKWSSKIFSSIGLKLHCLTLLTFCFVVLARGSSCFKVPSSVTDRIWMHQYLMCSAPESKDLLISSCWFPVVQPEACSISAVTMFICTQEIWLLRDIRLRRKSHDLGYQTAVYKCRRLVIQYHQIPSLPDLIMGVWMMYLKCFIKLVLG